MFLSKVELSPRAVQNEAFWREVSRPYGAHQAMWNLFARSAEQKRDFLFRAEEGTGRPRFFVLSVAPPEDDARGLWHVETKPFAPVLREGSRLGFKLRASPVVRRTTEDESGAKRTRRHDVVMDEKKQGPAGRTGSSVELIRKAGLRWLEKQAASAGFRLVRQEAEELGDDGVLERRPDAAVRVEGYRQHRIARRGEEAITFSTLEYEGILEVVDPRGFLAKVASGFGPQKAFGCGLMLLRRA